MILTMVLNLPWDFPTAKPSNWHEKDNKMLLRAQDEQQWNIFAVSSWDEMVAFAQEFSRQQYQDS